MKPNRIEMMFDVHKAVIEESVASGQITEAKLSDLNRTMDMDFDEYCKFQDIKSAAQGDSITLDEAQTIYSRLGHGPDDFNRQPIYVKITLTKVFGELLRARQGARAAAMMN